MIATLIVLVIPISFSVFHIFCCCRRCFCCDSGGAGEVTNRFTLFDEM